MGGGHSGGRIGGGGGGGGGSVVDRYDDLKVVGKQQKIQSGKEQPKVQTPGVIQGYMQSTAGGLAITLLHQAVAMLAPWALPLLLAVQIAVQVYNYAKTGLEIYRDSQQGAKGLRRALRKIVALGTNMIISSGEQRLVNGSNFRLRTNSPVKNVSVLAGPNPVLLNSMVESVESSTTSTINDYISNFIAGQIVGTG